MAAQHVYQVSPTQVSFLGLILIAEFIFSQSVWLDDKEEEDGAHVDINKIFFLLAKEVSRPNAELRVLVSSTCELSHNKKLLRALSYQSVK